MRSHELHEKLKLVQSLKTLAKQHELVLAAYERKLNERLQDPSRQGASVGGKRAGPPLIAEGPEAKRQRQLIERDRRKKELWDEIIRIVEKVRKNPKSEAFRQPVDIVKLKIPDYFTIIHHPMDISTVLKKLRSNPRQYSQPLEAAEDMRLIWRNCRTYNGEKHVVTQCANVLSENFEKLWGQANIESRWQVEMKREEREEQAFADSGGPEGEDEALVTALRYKRQALGDLIAAKDVQENVPPGSLGELQPDRDMTFEEKRKLSAHMASIPGEKLTAVLDIIAECEAIPSDDEAEYELDVDALNNATLWKLKAYVDGVLTATSGPPPKKTSANRASAGGAPNKTSGSGAAAVAVPPPAAATPPPALPVGPGAAAGHGQPAAAAAPAAAAPGAAAVGNGPVGQQQQLAAQPPLQPPQQRQQQLPPPLQQEPQQQLQHQQQGLQPPPPQKPPLQQQQQPDSPASSGGASADEVVASTAPGGGARQVTHHTLGGDAFTVAQSGTNVRSNFVKSKPRPVAGAADASKPGQPAAMEVDAVNDDWTALAKDAAGQQDEPAAAAAKPDAAGAGAAAAAAGGAGGKGEGDAAGGGGAAAEDMWDEFAEKAKQEEEKLQKQKEEEDRRKREEEEQKRRLEEQERQKELERQQAAEDKKAAAADELLVKGPPAGAAQENNQVQSEMDKLLGGAAAMEVEVEEEEEEEEEDEDAGAAGDADMAEQEEAEEGEAAPPA